MNDIIPLIGIETEYGIVREDLEQSDPVEESMRLLKACELKSTFGSWAYSRESAHVDLRGFQVARLAQDEEEDDFCAQDRKRPYSYLEMKSDRVLVNGARFYNDHTHPEYSTPECRDLFQLVAHDSAGEKIVSECVRLRNKEIGSNSLHVFKNNTDYSGHSYGTHDNYLIPRKLAFDIWVQYLVPFLVTRQLYAGAGKVGFEGKGQEPFTGLQLAQRSDFIESVLSIETMTQRPIINTRDEPHASPKDYRRLHLILGDANMSDYATALKIGSTRLVLSLIAREKLPAPIVLAEPVGDVQKVSRDKTGKVLLRQASGKTITPVEIQEWYLEQAKQHMDSSSEEESWVVREWTRTLDEFKNHPEKLADRIDWAIKENLFSQFMDEEGLDWDDPMMQSLDLEYHNLDPERGLYLGLAEEGSVTRLMTREQENEAAANPPEGTRAMIRGQAVDKELEQIKTIHWTGIEFKNGDYVDLTNVIHADEVSELLISKKEQFA